MDGILEALNKFDKKLNKLVLSSVILLVVCVVVHNYFENYIELTINSNSGIINNINVQQEGLKKDAERICKSLEDSLGTRKKLKRIVYIISLNAAFITLFKHLGKTVELF
jgi:hypothetical protein